MESWPPTLRRPPFSGVEFADAVSPNAALGIPSLLSTHANSPKTRNLSSVFVTVGRFPLRTFNSYVLARLARGLHAHRLFSSPRSRRLPTLIRLVIVLGGLAALAYGGVFYLATFVKFTPHEISETVALPKAPK
jgi:hypothetical protein